MKKILTYTLSFAMLVNVSFAQDEFDVLRYSTIGHYGDARYNAMGGSFGALGANLSALSVNPAGLGVYKSSDISFSPAFHYNYSESNKDGNLVTDGKLNFHFSSLGLAGNFEGNGDWEVLNVAIGYNRLSNYNTSISIKSSTNNSFLDTYTSELNSGNGTPEEDISIDFPFASNLAYQTYLVNPLVLDSLKYDHVFVNSNNMSQLTSYETRGGAGEMYLAFGSNYSNKLYIGGLLGIPTVRYVYDKNYTETADPSDTLTDFQSFSVHDYIKTSGTGINLKLGMIYKVNDWFRVGAAFHTPTFYSLTDEWYTTISSEDKLGEVLTEDSPLGNFNYFVTTPYRFISSAAVVVGMHGVINADYEIVDYATARIKGDQSFGVVDFSSENERIRNNFKLTHNLKIGTEWRIDPFRVRAGYRFEGAPINNSVSGNSNASTYTFGIGIKQDEYYFDMAYSLNARQSEAAIVSEEKDLALVNMKNHYVVMTLGFRL